MRTRCHYLVVSRLYNTLLSRILKNLCIPYTLPKIFQRKFPAVFASSNPFLPNSVSQHSNCGPFNAFAAVYAAYAKRGAR